MDPVGAGKGVLTLAKLSTNLYRFVTTDPKAIGEALAENYRDFVAELGGHVAYLSGRILEHGERIEDVEARLESFAADAQSRRVLHNFGYEAMREALDERRKMLAAAAAALTLLEMPIDAKARCERVLRQLDVADILWLEVIDRICGVVFGGYSRAGETSEIRHIILQRSASRDALVSSGCIAIAFMAGLNSAGTPLANVSPTGRLVLRTLRSWLREKELPLADIPGRPRVPGSRTGDVARAFVDEHAPGLRALLPRLAKRSRARFSAVICGVSASDLPASNGKATLHIAKVDHEDAALLQGMPSGTRELLDVPGGVAFEAVVVVVRDVDGAKHKTVDVYGPRDALAQVAEDIDARWV